MLTHSLLTGTMDVRLIYPAYRRQAKRLPAAAGNIPPGIIRARCEGYGASILFGIVYPAAYWVAGQAVNGI